MTGHTVGFTLLGTLGVETDGDVHRIGSGPQRVILAALMLQANRVVSAEHLSALIWEDKHPVAPRQALHNHVMRLRKAVGPVAARRIRTQSPGWVVDISPGELDLHRFDLAHRDARAAADEGDWRRAADLLDAALAQWNGEPLTDVPSQRLQLEVRDHLVEQRFQAVQTRIDADLHLGRFEDAAGRVRRILADRPLHEGLHGRLLVALHGSGRQSEALAAFREIRDTLNEELGIEPGQELRDLHQAILRQQPVATLVEPFAGLPPGTQKVTGPAPEPEASEAPEAPDTLSAVEALTGPPTTTPRAGSQKSAFAKIRHRWLVAFQAVIVTAALFVLAEGDFGNSPKDSAPASDSSVHPAVQKKSPDGQVEYLGRIASDAQILTTSVVEVPVLHDTRERQSVVVSLTLTGTSTGAVNVTDTAGNIYRMVGDVMDAHWHRTMLFAAFDAKPLTTADQISANYPAASKYHIAVDVFSGIHHAGQQAGSSNEWGSNTREFTTGGTDLVCAPGDLLISAIATNTGPAPRLVDGWQTLPELRLSSYRQTTGYRFIQTAGKCAATGTTTAQWEAVAVVLRR